MASSASPRAATPPPTGTRSAPAATGPARWPAAAAPPTGATATICGQRCATDAECATPNVCVRGSCGKKPNGEPCSASNAAECASGICAQGVCCAGACNGSCVSCALPQSAGVCTPVAAGAADPAGLCQHQAPPRAETTVCATGVGPAGSTPSGTVCANATCSAGRGHPGLALRRQRPLRRRIDRGLHAHHRVQRGRHRLRDHLHVDSQCVAGNNCFLGRCGLLDHRPALHGPTRLHVEFLRRRGLLRPRLRGQQPERLPGLRARGGRARWTGAAGRARAARGAATATPAP